MAVVADFAKRSMYPWAGSGVIYYPLNLPIATTGRVRVAFGGGVFVAVTYGAVAANTAWSYDGFNWNSVNGANTNLWHEVCFGNGVFISVSSNNAAGNQIMRSTDRGKTWTAIAAPNVLTYNGVCYAGNNTFVGCAQNGAVGIQFIRSTDLGLTWGVVASPNALTWQSMKSDGLGNVVAVASSGVGNQVAQSSDYGATFNARAESVTRTWRDLAFGDGRIIAANTNGANDNMYSDDLGVTWNTGSNPINVPIYVVGYSKELHRYLLHGYHVDHMLPAVSYDGKDFLGYDWVATSAPGDAAITGCAYGNNRWVALGVGVGMNCFVS